MKPEKRSIFNICNDDLKFILSELKTSIIKLKNAKILITGGTGFFVKSIMSSIEQLKKLLNLNIKIFVLSRNPSKFKNKFPEVRNYKELFLLKEIL